MNTQTNFADPEMTIDGGEGSQVEAPDINALTQLNAAEISQQIMTARAYPRSVTGFRRSMREMVTYNEATALSCLYALSRGKKVIEGPSIRFAEAAVQAWGNSRVGARIVDIGDTFITAQGFFYDLEKNMAVAFEVMRRITNKEGQRFNDDMIGVTGNAACSIALRNAILKGIPRTAWDEPYQAARRLSIGEGESITGKRDQMLRSFAPLGVDKEQIFGLLGVKGIADVSYDHLILMAGILNSIKDGDQTVEQAFALENMSHPDQVRPPQPKKTDFVGADKKQAGKPSAGAATSAQDKTTAQVPEPTKTAEPVADSDTDRKVMVASLYEELEAVRRVRDVPALMDRGIDMGIMTVEEEADWTKACQARSDAIVNTAKQARTK